jgi:hypothetical protein
VSLFPTLSRETREILLPVLAPEARAAGLALMEHLQLGPHCLEHFCEGYQVRRKAKRAS